jgi:hypothetical protein
MLINQKEIDKFLEEVKLNPEKASELLKNLKIVHAVFDENDGIPPRFGSNFRDNGPKWEKVTGLDFEAIGRILVCHLSIEHYINNLIELSTPIHFDWDNTRMTFSQKLKLVSNINILNKNKFDKGIEILNNIRNKLSHNMLAKIDEVKFKELKQILLNYLCFEKSKEEIKEIEKHYSQFDTFAIIETFTSIVCAIIGGYCISLINIVDPEKSNAETYYKHVRDSK